MYSAEKLGYCVASLLSITVAFQCKDFQGPKFYPLGLLSPVTGSYLPLKTCKSNLGTSLLALRVLNPCT